MINRKSQLSKGSIGVYLALILSACTTINMHRPPPKDWPQLTESVVNTSFYDVQVKCGGNALTMILGMHYYACAWVNFDNMTCTIFTATEDEYVMEHERSHCLGYDHYGSSPLADYWNEWKRQNRSALK